MTPAKPPGISRTPAPQGARTGQGGGEARVNYTLNGKSRMPLDPLGAASARLVGEARCAG